MDEIFKIGDIVILNKKEILKWCHNTLPIWYSADEFKIVGHDKIMKDVVILNKDLPNLNPMVEPNKIRNTLIKKATKVNRREKLKKLNLIK
jgi:hypothetical protein